MNSQGTTWEDVCHAPPVQCRRWCVLSLTPKHTATHQLPHTQGYELGNCAASRVTPRGGKRSCRGATRRSGLLAQVTECRKDRTWGSCDYRESPSVLAALNGCGREGTNGRPLIAAVWVRPCPGQGSGYGTTSVALNSTAERSAGRPLSVTWVTRSRGHVSHHRALLFHTRAASLMDVEGE